MADNLSINQAELLKKLKAISGDLWGMTGPTAGNPADGAQPAVEKPEEKAKPGVKKPAVVPGKKDPDNLDTLWFKIDETIDWTDALAHATPSDGLTPQGLWEFYRSQAAKVLRGDLGAYREVLKRTNPLGELTNYADGLSMRVPDADRAEGTFTCNHALLEKKGKAYLSAMGVRIARDLMACLPVIEAGVTAYDQGEEVMQVTYSREQLMHKNLQFSDPVTVTEACGAVFGPALG